MQQYSGLARIYDYLVQGVDFEDWIDYVEALLDLYGGRVKKVADLACGTGNTTLPFARRGYTSWGVDLAPDMLSLARHKAEQAGLKVEFIQQDMRQLALPEPVDLVTAFHDGLNYLLELADLRATFLKVQANLTPGGFFIFDLNAVRWLAIPEKQDDTVVVEEPDLTLIWNTSYDPLEEIWQIKLSGFYREGEYYQKFTEEHREKAYDPALVKSTLLEAGFKLLGSFDAFTFNEISPASRRHFYVAKKSAAQ